MVNGRLLGYGVAEVTEVVVSEVAVVAEMVWLQTLVVD